MIGWMGAQWAALVFPSQLRFGLGASAAKCPAAAGILRHDVASQAKSHAGIISCMAFCMATRIRVLLPARGFRPRAIDARYRAKCRLETVSLAPPQN